MFEEHEDWTSLASYIAGAATILGSFLLISRIFEGKDGEFLGWMFLLWPSLLSSVFANFTGIGMLLSAASAVRSISLSAGLLFLSAAWQAVVVTKNSRNFGGFEGIEIEPLGTELIDGRYLVSIGVIWIIAIGCFASLVIKWWQRIGLTEDVNEWDDDA